MAITHGVNDAVCGSSEDKVFDRVSVGRAGAFCARMVGSDVSGPLVTTSGLGAGSGVAGTCATTSVCGVG